MTDIETYIKEMSVKFIIGSEPLPGFNEFVNKIKKMNIEEAISNQQAAFDRFNARR